MNVSTNVCDIANSSGLTEGYWKIEKDHEGYAVGLAVFLILCEIVGLPWNIAVVVSIIREKLYSQPTIILLLNVVLTDFILLLSAPPFIIPGFTKEFIFGYSDSSRCISCTLVNQLVLFIFYNSIVSVALMSLDRFFYIYMPFRYDRTSTKYIALASVLASLLLGIVLALLYVVMHTSVYFNVRGFCATIHDDRSRWAAVLITATMTTVILFTVVINLSFSYIVLKTIRAVYSKHYTDNKDKKTEHLRKRVKSTRQKKQTRLCYMLISFLLASLISILPTGVSFVHVLTNPTKPIAHPSIVLVLFTMIFYCQAIVHPVLETIFIVDIRRSMKKMIINVLLCRRTKTWRNSKNGEHQSFLCGNGRCSYCQAFFESSVQPQIVDDVPTTTSITEL